MKQSLAPLATLSTTLALLVTCARGAPTTVSQVPGDTHVVANAYLSRAISLANGKLATAEIVNRRAGTKARPGSCEEFRLRVSEGTHTVNTDKVLTAADFRVTGCRASDKGLSVELESKEHQLRVKVIYELADDDFFMRKRLEIQSGKPVTLERIDVEAIAFDDASQPYALKQIYARGKWSPGLGQPLYTKKSGTFWGIEFPAAYNHVEDGSLRCGYQPGRELKPGTTYRTYPAVLGASDDPAFVTDAFFDYIDRIRARPLRLQIQYNSWFDFGRGVSRENFRGSVSKIHQELVVERGNRPLRNYVIDDGWQNSGKSADWSDKVWKVNDKFEQDFGFSRETARSAQSELGLWLSPGCLFGASRMVGQLRGKGFEAMDNWMSLAGPKYMQKLESRMVELTKLGVSYFKLDGLFGHLNLRNFELHGERYGLPHMPQLGLEGLKAGDAQLNAAKFDELKIYYLAAGTERLMKIFAKMAEENPDVYIVTSNGAYLSPWWLMYVDSIWMINAGDAAGGSSRTQDLVYRDGRYFQIWQEENTQYPMCAIFNHEPKKRKTGEPADTFRKYLYMNLSRGTGFIELYLRTANLAEHDWDVLSEGLHWAYEVFPVFRRSRMHGGDPRKGEAYGYTAWNEEQGYVTIHNPAAAAQDYSFRLDRAFGLLPGAREYYLSSPVEADVEGLRERFNTGDMVSLRLKPREVRVLNFDAKPRTWDKLRALQRKAAESEPEQPEPVAIRPDHPILGTWHYTHGGTPYSREFKQDGTCILWRGKEINWTKMYEVRDDRTAIVAGSLEHVINKDGVLEIEGRYRAEKKP